MNAPLFQLIFHCQMYILTLPCYGSVPIPLTLIILTLIILTLTTINNPNKTSYYSQYNIIFPKKITQKILLPKYCPIVFVSPGRRFPKSNYIYPLYSRFFINNSSSSHYYTINTKPPLFSPLLSVYLIQRTNLRILRHICIVLLVIV